MSATNKVGERKLEKEEERETEERERVICHIDKSNGKLLFKVAKTFSFIHAPFPSMEHNGHFTDFTHHLEMTNGNVVVTGTENETKNFTRN